MPIALPESCPRSRTDCQPLSQVVSDCGDTFVCCGHLAKEHRARKGDCFRHCFKSVGTDTMYDYDHLDMLDTISVLSAAMAIKRRM